jgi:O-methyltransferase
MAGRFRRRARRALARLLWRFGYELVPRQPSVPPDCDSGTAAIVRKTRPYTLASPERIMALCEAVRYVERANVPGSIVECGVWRGGGMMAAALALVELGAKGRDFYLFDTFREIPPPDQRDEHITMSQQELSRFLQELVPYHLPLDRVRRLLESTGYPADRFRFVPGLVEETIPAQAPEAIALCRLDTDWYRSTAHEMEHLYPRISPGGILLVDDYGELAGARRAVDEYLTAHTPNALLNRIDVTARLLVVPDGHVTR